ncbi:uncharacterized protein LOC124929102 isoform X2 [Impatiens glandulifera]|uniref:uncharacterized protein LOC124929102 isoform X2 n=1 Tax=Impatiens glandulifera TaxID=253017 RepID=UPI001FB17E1C|nr:uncharacterized protein LOC124929102 isoform X2 [Impatiens glandulifera]
MDKYIVRVVSNSENPKPLIRPRWRRSIVELNGRFEPMYRRDVATLLTQSYSQIGCFPHSYHNGGFQCPTHMNWFANAGFLDNMTPFQKQGVTSVEFDNKGVYLASVTKDGCLTIHDFETLYCQVDMNCPSRLKEDETKHLLHISTSRQLDVVRWNPANQDEIACTSLRSGEVQIFNIGYISSEPVEVLRKRPVVNIHGREIPKGLTDIAFSKDDNPRVFASDIYGGISMWDRRVSHLPCLALTSDSNSRLNSIQLIEDNQVLLGASKDGLVYLWDLRGGRSSMVLQSQKEGHLPLTSLKLATSLEKIGSLKAQSNISSKEIHSITVDPTCPYHLAFHLDDGWSGVLDLHNFEVTHVHCPPPPWLVGGNHFGTMSLRKPSWISTHSIYVVGSAYNSGLHFLDFYPDSSSPCHVNFNLLLLFCS